ncbi:MAG: heme-binding domain-containing protein [Planctomycetota bacterium]|nr:MAG: heme-binding domain-containing protein [Planctomycetota bacterium]
MRLAYLLSTIIVLIGGGLHADDSAAPYGIEKRTPWTTSRLVGSPEPPLPYTVEETFTKLDLKTPIYILEEPGTGHLLVILHPEGDNPSRIVRFANDPECEQFDVFYASDDRLIYSLCFDPDYEKNRQVYIFSNGPKPESERRNRLARFRVTADDPPRIDPESEEILLDFRSGGHDGGDMAFGNDGMLYVTTGDGTSDSDGWNSGQTLDDLLGAVLRIDVHTPSDDKPYSVPPDNPFVDVKGACGEVWAYGLRNPWRMGIDPVSGQVWVGNNGQDLWETAHLVRRGENYGWSVYEGNHPFYLQRQLGPTPLVPPTIEHSHAEFRSLTGGVVYRGDKLADLDGAYVYGDYSSGRIWGMKHDGQRVLWHKELADTSLMIAAFRSDHRGEMLVADHGSGIYRLVPSPPSDDAPPFPRKLSETGLFRSVAAHEVDPGLVPYAVNAPAWNDGATAERFIALPGDAQATHHAGRSWDFPDGMALVQTLSLERTSGDPATRFCVETRVLLRQQGEWAGYSYRWNDEQSDAALVDKLGAEAAFAIHEAGGQREQTWRFPARVECMTCHSRAANFVLGLCNAQLNRDYDYGAVADNQLRTLSHVGLFAKPPDKPPGELEKLCNPYDKSQQDEARARSYLHVNCSVCHVAAGGGNARMVLTHSTNRGEMELIEARPQHNTFGIPNAMLVAPGDPDRSVLLTRLSQRGRGQMPPLVTTRVDQQAVELFRAWISGLEPSRPIVRNWQTGDLLADLDGLDAGRSVEAGQTAFREIGCSQCHRVADDGGTVGPDLTDAAKRLSPKELLESIIEPSKQVADQYATWIVQTEDGKVRSGRIEREDDRVLILRGSDALEPPTEIEQASVTGRRKSPVSNMPEGTVNVLHKEELLDLLAYLLNGTKQPDAE